MSDSSHIPTDVLTQMEIEPGPETFAGVSCRERQIFRRALISLRLF